MTLLVDSVIAKVRSTAPGTGTRWPDSALQKLVHAADCSISEAAEKAWSTHDISLLADAFYYALPEDVIAVKSVTYSSDGTNFDDGVLLPMTYDKLDGLSLTWMDDRGTQPHHYWLLSCPGVIGYSKIGVYRAMSTVTSEQIRVTYLACTPDNNATFEALATPDAEWIEDDIYVPYVLAHMAAPVEPKLAKMYMDRFWKNLPEARIYWQARQSEYPAQMRGIVTDPKTQSEGYI